MWADLPARLAVLLACLLFGIYLLAYVNQPDSADGQALLAVASTAVQQGRFDINVIGYTEWLLTESGRMGSLGVDGALYAKKAPTPSLALLPLTLLARVIPWLPVRATAMLFNPLVTTLTALALYHLARVLRYGAGLAFILGLIYGLTTFAFPYVNTLFGEPLAALLLVMAVIFAQPRFAIEAGFKPAALVGCGTALGLLVGVNTIYALGIPLFALYLLWRQPLQGRTLVAFVAPLLLCGLLLALYNWGRFGSPLESGYHFAAGEGFTTPLLSGLYGLFFSPYRGLFWYSPILLLSIPGWLMLRRAHARLAWLIVALILLQALAFAGWWSWHGGIVWGPRFLLPALPLLVLCLAPLIAAARHQRWLWVVLGGLGIISLGVQLLGVLYDYLIYEGLLRQTFWPDLVTSNQVLLTSPPMFHPAYSPILGHLALLVTGWPVRPAWLHHSPDVLHLVGALLVTGSGGLFFFLNGQAARYLKFPLAFLCVLAVLIIAARQGDEADTQAAYALRSVMQPPGVTLAATSLLDDALLEINEGVRVISMHAPTTPDDSRARQVYEYARQEGSSSRPFWYMTWFGAGDPLNWPERDLWHSAYFVQEASAVGHRALRFDLTPPQEPLTPGGWRFGTIMLDSYALAADPDGVRLTLQWTASEALDTDYTWFAHLLEASGAIIAQQDRPPQGGYAPTHAWRPGELVIDRLFFPLPAAEETSSWQVRLGWVDPASGERLPAFKPDGASVPEGFILVMSHE